MRYKLNEVIEIIGGGTPKRTVKEYWNGDIPWISVKDFTTSRWINKTCETITDMGLKKSSTNVMNKGDLVISARGTVGLVAQINKKMAFNQSCYGLKGISKYITNDYLYYWLKQNVMYVKSNTHGSVFDTITRDTFSSLQIEIPSINIQKKVTKLLTSFDSKIDLNNQIINTLEETVTTLFNHWFIDFEFPDKNGNPYKSSGGKMVESELGEIPEEFQLVELGNIIENIKDKILVEDLSLDNYASTENLLAGKLGKMQATKLPTVKSVKCYRNDDVLISNIRPYFKKIWKAVGKGGYSNDVLNFRAKRAICLPEFLYSFLQRDDFFEFMTLTSKGTKMPRGDKQAIATLKLALPNMDMMLCYSEKTIPLFNMINQRKSENETLKELRDTLLPKLLSGEIELE
ncbi:restriction endonuclease subunit S [Enterococcus sp. AZ126]|uniref:restriction endonuclease subunit S n=1 Tax=Enterococcus sp. AZ126 TaxID=2774635 RepID=UPI003F21B3D5